MSRHLNLNDLQNTFIDALKDNDAADILFSCINEADPARINVYRNNRRQGLIKTLATDFPMTKKVLGDDLFDALAVFYDQYAPLKTLDLDMYGSRLPEYIKKHPNPDLAHKIKKNGIPITLLSDLSRLEMLANQSDSAADRKVFDSAAFATLSEQQYENIIFILSPDIRIMASAYALDSLWKMTPARSTEENQQSMKDILNVQGHNCADMYYFCLHRPKFALAVTRIEKRKKELIEQIKTGNTFATLTKDNDNVAIIIELVERGWIHDFAEA